MSKEKDKLPLYGWMCKISSWIVFEPFMLMAYFILFMGLSFYGYIEWWMCFSLSVLTYWIFTMAKEHWDENSSLDPKENGK